MRYAVLLPLAAMVSAGPPALAQTPVRTPEQLRADYDAHSGDFDYLLGDWEFTATSREFGNGDEGNAPRISLDASRDSARWK